MARITEVTRRDFAGFFTAKNICWYGCLEETEFRARLYDLEDIPSTDSRFDDAAGDIQQHRINNNDWDDDWIFFDERFKLCYGDDDNFFLRFLCETLHPVVCSNREEVLSILQDYNRLLAPDGYEIFQESRVSGRPTYGFREIAPRITIPFHYFYARKR